MPGRLSLFAVALISFGAAITSMDTAIASPREPVSGIARNSATHRSSRDIRRSAVYKGGATMRCTPSGPKNMMVCRRDERAGAKSSLKRSSPHGLR